MPAVITQAGALNTTALIVPDAYVQIVPPSVNVFNGQPTNVLGVVGTASWGPVNQPAIVGSMQGFAQLFGPIQPRKYDLGTQVATAVQQGAGNFRCVRVTDGTDTAASAALDTAPVNITFASKYTGSYGNGAQVTISPGSSSTAAMPTFKLTVAMPGVQEVFDNIGGTGAALWANMANAVNNGISAIRGPSALIVATAGTGAAAPVPATTPLTGGTDGAGTITATTLVGQDTIPRKGMFALRSQGVSVAWLADADDSTQWAGQLAFGISEGIYMIGTGPVGDTIANAITAKQTAGIDSPWFKLMFGDWIYWQDSVNNVLRLVSPQGFVGGLLGNLSPQNSTLNKQLFGVVGTQRSSSPANGTYAYAELQSLIGAGFDLIANPSPGGAYFGAQAGHNSSSDPARNTDAYTRMTNFIAASLGAATGRFVGQLQTPQQQLDAKASLDDFFSGLEGQGQISAFKVTLDASNNPQSRQALGYEQADIQVTYLNVVEKFLVNFQGGGSVTIAAAVNQN
ncbi:MAG TPA: phage tail protein [Aliidongia sp.]|nr:phage tail protein [Aliidongia sp.]